MGILLFVFIPLAALAPGFAWLFFFLKEDVHPEPKRLIVYVFGMGMIASIPIVLLQIAGQAIFSPFSALIVLIFLALVEEAVKFGAAYFAIAKHPAFNEPIDAMIYMIVAALGLATAENLFVLADTIGVRGITAMTDIVDVVVLRFVGATFLHALASGLMGYYWAVGKLRNSVGKYVMIGIAVATIVHVIFNTLILTFQNIDFLIYPSLFLVGASFFLFKDFEKLKARSK